ncbi:MAG: hypothetical protein GOP50_12705 [Candidatus Heimdallarchaeota archaeon]|nr:hypothetical protein [Candidatus Heimdallarchaeota archaeon]
MIKQATFLMCSPRGEKSGSYSLGNYFSSLIEEKGITVKSFHIYKTLRKNEKVDEMIESINESDIILLSTPLYIDSAPHMTIRLMDAITDAKNEGKIEDKNRLFLAILCAGFLEYYHNNLAIKMYKQFAKRNNFTWAGGFPIGAAGTYAHHTIPDLIEQLSQLPEDDVRSQIYGKPVKILDSVMKAAVEYVIKGEIIPKEELQKLEYVSMPLENYVTGGNQSWINWAESIGTAEKLRDKPYEKR